MVAVEEGKRREECFEGGVELVEEGFAEIARVFEVGILSTESGVGEGEV